MNDPIICVGAAQGSNAFSSKEAQAWVILFCWMQRKNFNTFVLSLTPFQAYTTAPLVSCFYLIFPLTHTKRIEAPTNEEAS